MNIFNFFLFCMIQLHIKKNLIHCAELKKHNTRFYSEVLRKKFFVLYEDSRRSVTNPRDHTADTADSGAEPRPSEVRKLYIGGRP